jgi:hypothetical protein
MKIPYIAQISVLTLIVIVGVVLLIAMSGKTATIPAIIPAAGQVNLEEALVIEQPTEVAETTPAGPEVILGDAVYTGFDGTIAQSNIIDSNLNLPLADLEVKTYCDAKEGDLFVGKTFTGADGLFKINAQDIFNACEYGKQAWFKVEYNGQSYKSPEIPIPEKNLGGISMNRPLKLTTGTEAYVPEFSTATLALAVIGAGLGLVLVRKQH